MTAAIIPSVGPVERLEGCIAAISAQTAPFSRVLIVSDGAPAVLEAGFIGVGTCEVLRLQRRHGFAGAVNAGIRKVLEDPGVTAVALINDDVRLDQGWHEAVSTVLDSHEEMGVCATVVLQSRDPERLDSAGIEWRSGAMADNRGHGDSPPSVVAPPEEVWGATAAAAVYRRSLFDRVGLFDESFTAYQEDVELALRARLHGLGCVLAPAARSEHDGFGSNLPFPGGGTWADFYNARNRITLLITTFPTRSWRREWRRIVVRHLQAVGRAPGEGRMAAVWLGAAHALWKIPWSLRRRRWIMRAARIAG